MVKPFDKLYDDLDQGFKKIGEQYRGTERYLRGIQLVRHSIGKMHGLAVKFVREGEREIEYFQNVWPGFYGKLLLYIRLHGAESQKVMVPADDWAAVIGEEEQKVRVFFCRHRDFWQYYRSGPLALGEQFTRAYSRDRIFEPLALVIDAQGATLASYRAATCLAMEGYGEWLREERADLAVGRAGAADLGYSWGATDADLAEWLFGLQAVGALQYKGQAADISRLQKWARMAVGRKVANIYDRGRVLRNRKKERLAFTQKIAAALGKKWDEAEGRFE